MPVLTTIKAGGKSNKIFASTAVCAAYIEQYVVPTCVFKVKYRQI